MRKTFFITVLYSLISMFFLSEATCQEKARLNIKIIEKQTGNAIFNAIIKGVNKKGEIAFEATTDSLGYISIAIPVISSIEFLQISSFGFEGTKIKADKLTFQEREITIKLKSKNFLIEEVVIKKPSSQGRFKDSTIIHLANHEFASSLMTDKILTNQFGFYKDHNGNLYFNGEVISDITVNGERFFDIGTEDIFKLLPALTIENIVITKTNIDSVSNMTLPKSISRVNIQLKEEYNTGKMGISNVGLGNSFHKLIHGSIFSFKKQNQTSVSFNTNDINAKDDMQTSPEINYVHLGNISNITSGRITDKRALIRDKLLISTNIKARQVDQNSQTATIRNDELTNITTLTESKGRNKNFNIDNATAELRYKFDKNTSFAVMHTYNYNNSKEYNSTNYDLILPKGETKDLHNVKTRHRDLQSHLSNATFESHNLRKKGRRLIAELSRKIDRHFTGEMNYTSENLTQNMSPDNVRAQRSAEDLSLQLRSEFSEPLGDNSVIGFKLAYQHNNTTSNETDEEPTTHPLYFRSTQLSAGINYNLSWRNIFTDSYLGIIDNRRNIRNIELPNTELHFLNFNGRFNTSISLKNQQHVIISYSTIVTPPHISQLTNINSTFDIISQTFGNPYLKPETKKRSEVAYTKNKDSKAWVFTAGIDIFNEKFGHNTIIVDNTQLNVLENVGKSISVDLSSSFSFLSSEEQFWEMSVSSIYAEMPYLLNGSKIDANTFSLNGSIRTNMIKIGDFLSSNSVFTTTTGRNSLGDNILSRPILNLRYSSFFSIDFQKLKFGLYPWINYSTGIFNDFSWAVNAEIKKDILRGFGELWVKAYDIFDSYQFNLNNVGMSFLETQSYTNLQRFILVGLTLKFNNMKS